MSPQNPDRPSSANPPRSPITPSTVAGDGSGWPVPPTDRPLPSPAPGPVGLPPADAHRAAATPEPAPPIETTSAPGGRIDDGEGEAEDRPDAVGTL